MIKIVWDLEHLNLEIVWNLGFVILKLDE